MRHILSIPYLKLSLAISGVLYFALGNIVYSAESNATLPAHGRPITITESPTIEGTGNVSGTIKSTSFPAHIDLDDDPLVGWYYTWLVGGAPATTETQINPTGVIQPYIPAEADVGKDVTLKLRAISDDRAYPADTRVSDEVVSNSIKVITPVAPPPVTSIPNSGWLGYGQTVGTFIIDGEPVTVTATTSGIVSSPTASSTFANPLPWPQGANCGNYFLPTTLWAERYSGNATKVLTFSRPVTNIQITAGWFDGGSTMTFTTDKQNPVLTPIQIGNCSLPNINGNYVSNQSISYNLVVGGHYYTRLRIVHTGDASWGTQIHYNYSMAKVIK